MDTEGVLQELVGPCGLEPQTCPTGRAALPLRASNQLANASSRFPALDLSLPAPGPLQRGEGLLIDKNPWAATTGGRGVTAVMLGQASDKVVGRADVETARGETLENVESGHRRNGRPVRTRTADLYRVKVAL